MNWMMMKSEKSSLMTFSATCRNAVSDLNFWIFGESEYSRKSGKSGILLFFQMEDFRVSRSQQSNNHLETECQCQEAQLWVEET